MLMWFSTKKGKLFTCFAISIFIYFGLTCIYNISKNKVNKENEQNKAKSYQKMNFNFRKLDVYE